MYKHCEIHTYDDTINGLNLHLPKIGHIFRMHTHKQTHMHSHTVSKIFDSKEDNKNTSTAAAHRAMLYSSAFLGLQAASS